MDGALLALAGLLLVGLVATVLLVWRSQAALAELTRQSAQLQSRLAELEQSRQQGERELRRELADNAEDKGGAAVFAAGPR